MATHSSTLAWKIPWMEERGRLRSMGSQRGRATDFALLRQWGKLSNVTSYEGNGLVISPDMELLCNTGIFVFMLPGDNKLFRIVPGGIPSQTEEFRR